MTQPMLASYDPLIVESSWNDYWEQNNLYSIDK